MSWSDAPKEAPARSAPDGVIFTRDNRDTAILEIMAKGDPVAKALARAMANGWPDAAQQWFAAEAKATDLAMAFQALINMQLSLFAGLASNLPPSFDADMAGMYRRFLDLRLQKLIADSREVPS